jgi:predicted transglutaminase-like cysteine proteinase
MRWTAVVAVLVTAVLGGCSTTMSDANVSLLYMVNSNVNRTVAYVVEPAGQNEWKVAEIVGDCEDIAIRKRRDLINAGFAAEKLSVLVTPGHATLLARTEAGDYVLDNNSDRPTRWTGKGREYLPLGDKWLPRDYVLADAERRRSQLASAR